MTDERNEMTEKDFLAANFFTAENEMPARASKRTRRRIPPDIAALKYFAKRAVEMSPVQRRAAINWLIEAYLQ